MKPAISIQNIGKCYKVNHEQGRSGYRTLRETIVDLAAAPFRKFTNPGTSGKVEDFWAVKDVSFDVMPGEVVGIIGRNGAGKSTLLKILSRITPPTTGEIRVRGRLGSLLEVGTGFHPELTGRENVYMNGSILGMKRREIDKKFDEIVDFSGVEKFLDTPVKRYSSGMQVRLAFAVAAHLEPEILIVDEVLAVGDMAFQQKCMGRMKEVRDQGRTIFFVSHNMAAVSNLCTRAVILERGERVFDGESDDAIRHYFAAIENNSESKKNLLDIQRKPNLIPIIQKIEFISKEGASISTVPVGDPLCIRIHYRHSECIMDPYFGITIVTSLEVNLVWLQTKLQRGTMDDLPASGSVECYIPEIPLVPGTYWINVGCGSGATQLDGLEKVIKIDILENDYFGTGRLPQSNQSLVLINAIWSNDKNEKYEGLYLKNK